MGFVRRGFASLGDDEDARLEFERVINQAIEEFNVLEGDIDIGDNGGYDERKMECVIQAVEKGMNVLPAQERKKKEIGWFEAARGELVDLLKKKVRAWKVWKNNSRYKRGAQAWEDFEKAKQAYRRRSMTLREEFWTKKSELLQTLVDRHEYGSLQREIHDVSGRKLKSIKSGAVTAGELNIEEARGHFQGVLAHGGKATEAARIYLSQQREVEMGLAVPFTTKELDIAVYKMKHGRAVGPDNIPAEAFKYGGQTLRQILLDIS
jgi:hypothetical protein